MKPKHFILLDNSLPGALPVESSIRKGSCLRADLDVIACVGSPQSVLAKTVAHQFEYVFLEGVFVHPLLGNI
jgi:hypothetical protein